MSTTGTTTAARVPKGVSTGGQFAPVARPEATGLSLGGNTCLQAGVSLEAALQHLGHPMDAGDEPLVLTGEVTLCHRAGTVQATCEDRAERRFVLELTPTEAGVGLELYGREGDRADHDAERFNELAEEHLAAGHTAAVLLNPDNSLDSSVREFLAARCPVIEAAGADARALRAAHPQATVLAARTGTEGSMAAELRGRDGEVLATGIEQELDPVYAEGLDALDAFVESGAAGERCYDLAAMAGEPA